MKNDQTDEEIVRHVVQGDAEVYRIIVERYQQQVFSIGKRFFKNDDDAYDFTQEVLIKAYQKLDTFKGLSPFRFWLMKIAYNHGINRVKSKKEEKELLEQALSASDLSPEKTHTDEEIKELLLKAIDTLPENYKVCLDLYFFLGLNYNQISEITEIPVNTIKSNVFRAKQILRDLLRGTIAEEYYEM